MILEMMEEDKERECRCILEMATFIDRHSVKAIDCEQRAERLRSAETKYNEIQHAPSRSMVAVPFHDDVH